LEWDTRLGLRKMAFYIFVDWYEWYHRCTNGNLNGRKFFVEIPDLMSYINTNLFLYHLTSQRTSIAYNWIGTHPIENLFGYVRVNSHFDHTWPKFLLAVARAVITDDVLSANNMKPHENSALLVSKFWAIVTNEN
jgi:hypothetical protein